MILTVAGKVVDEPDQRDHRETRAIVLDDEQPRRLALGHCIALVSLGLGQLDPQVEEREWGNDSQTQADTPCRAQVLLGGGEHDEHGHDGGDDETKVDLHVGEEDEPAVSRARLELARAFGAAHAACRVFACGHQ